MAITRATNPVDDSEIVMITGKIDRIIIKEAEKTSKNIEYNTTHLASLLIDGVYVNYIALGIKEGREPNIAINTGTKDSPKWAQIQETDEVKVIVTEKVVGDKTYYSAKRTGIKLVKKNATPGQATQQQSSGSTGNYTPKEPYDETGMLVCHGINGAMIMIGTGRFGNSNNDITTLAKIVHESTAKLKKQVAQDNQDMKDKSVGNYSGNAIHAACLLVENSETLAEDLYNTAYDIVVNITLKLDEHIRAPKTTAPAVKTTRAPAKKPAATKAKAVVEEEVFPELDEEDDSNLPF